MKLYPNPTTNQTTIDLGETYTQVLITIYNTLGQKVYAQFYDKAQIIPSLLTEAKSGVYFIHLVEKENRTIQAKVVKQ